MKKRLSGTANEQGLGQIIVNHQPAESSDLFDEVEMESLDDTRLGAKRLFQKSFDEVDSSIFPYRTIYTKERSNSIGQTMKEKQPLTIETNSGVAAYRNSADFNFRLTEGQSRRGLMADCESECSPIFDFLFVGGAQIARSWKTLEEHGITRIINCSAAVVDNHFLNDPKMKYLSLNMVDGRQDDISWFLGDVLQFIMSGRKAGEKILIHCERGVSRSCSFAIAYHVWTTGGSWKDGFDYVKSRRACCAPNTAFTCNLIEISECLKSDWRNNTAAIFRCAAHLVPHDPNTPALKLCRNKTTRKCIVPRTSVLDPQGVYVIKNPEGFSRLLDESKGGNPTVGIVNEEVDQEGGIKCALEAPLLYLWIGSLASEVTVAIAADLALNLVGVFSYAQHIKHVRMTEEPLEFFRHIIRDGPFSFSGNEGECYTDLFVPRTYDSGFPPYNRSDSLVGRSGKGEKHFLGEKHFPHGRFVGSGSPEHSSELGSYKRTELTKMGLQINLKGIMPSATTQTITPKNSEMDTALSNETKSQLDKMSARSFHSSDSNDSCNDSDMFYNVYTSRSGFSEGSSEPVTPRSDGAGAMPEVEDKSQLVLEHLEHVSGEASPLTPRNRSPKKIQFPNERMCGGHLTVNTGDNLPDRLSGPILPLKSAVRTVVPVPALKMQTYTDRKDWPCGQSTTFASSPRSIEYAEYQKAFRGGSHQGSSSSLMSGIGGTGSGPGPRHTPMDPRVAWKESAQSSGKESSSTSGKDLFTTQSSKEYSPSSSQSKEYSPSSSQSKEYSPSSSQSKEYSPSSSQSAKEYSPSSSTQSGKESSPSYSQFGKEPSSATQSGKDSSATQSGKDSSDDSSTKPAPRRPGGFPPSPPTTVSRKPHIMNMGLSIGTETKSCNSSGSGSCSSSSSSSSSSSTSSSSASAVSYIASGSSMKESSIVSGLNSSTGGYALTSSSSSSTGTSYTYNNGSIFSANSNITSGSFSTTATTATTSTYAGNHAGFSSIAHGIVGNSLQSNVTSMLNSSMSSNTSTNSSNSPRYTGSPRSTTSSSSLRCSLATATAILMGIGAGARPSTPRKHASTSSSSPHGIMTPSGSSLNSRPSVISETDHNDESTDPREQFHRERKKDKLDGKSHSFRKDKERPPPPPSNTPTSFDSLSPSVYVRKLSSAPRVKVSSNTATVRSGISPTLESVTPSTSTKLALSAELLMLKINQSAYPESALDPSSARDTCMNAVANDLIGQSNATTTTTTPGPDREDVSQFSRLTSASEREEYPLYSRLGSTDDQRLTRGNSVDDWRHNYDILMLSQRSSANDGQFMFSRQGSVNTDSQFLNSRANSSSNYNSELFHLPRQTSIDERIYPQNPSEAHSNSPTLKREHSLNFGSVVSPRIRTSGTSTSTPSNPYTPNSRIIERDKVKDKDKDKDKDKVKDKDKDKDGKDRDKDREKEKEGRERERDRDKDKDRDRDRAKGKSPSSINTDTGSIRKRSMSTLPPLSPTFDFGSRAFRLPIDINLVRAPDTPLTSERTDGIALDAASSLCSSGRIYDISSRSSRSREMSRKSSTASIMLMSNNGSNSGRNSTRDRTGSSDPAGIDLLLAPFSRTSSIQTSEGSPRGTIKIVNRPRLYQAGPVPLKCIKSAADLQFVWDGLGIYEDEDLNESELLLLTCPQPPHFLWVGCDFRITALPGTGPPNAHTPNPTPPQTSTTSSSSSSSSSIIVHSNLTSPPPSGRFMNNHVSASSISSPSASNSPSSSSSCSSSMVVSTRNSSDNLTLLLPTQTHENPESKVTPASVLRWVTHGVSRGEIPVEDFPDGSFSRPGAVEIIWSGEETDEFWAAFNEGC